MLLSCQREGVRVTNRIAARRAVETETVLEDADGTEKNHTLYFLSISSHSQDQSSSLELIRNARTCSCPVLLLVRFLGRGVRGCHQLKLLSVPAQAGSPHCVIYQGDTQDVRCTGADTIEFNPDQLVQEVEKDTEKKRRAAEPFAPDAVLPLQGCWRSTVLGYEIISFTRREDSDGSTLRRRQGWEDVHRTFPC